MSNDNSGAGALIWLVIIGVIIFWSDIWNTKFRYGLALDLPTDKITIDKKPKDCEFLTAPLGSKNCHYDKSEQKIEMAMSKDGKSPLISYDEGKSWSPIDPPTGVKVPQYPTVVSAQISWIKVTD